MGISEPAKGISEPKHRKVLSTSTKLDKPQKALLVENACDKDFRLRLLELEIEALSISQALAQLKLTLSLLRGPVTQSTSKWECDWEDTSAEYRKWMETYMLQVSNTLPDTEEASNKFETDKFNMLVVNPGGLHGKRQSITNAIHLYDIRAVVVSETHAPGKTVPKLDDTMKAFFHNRSAKTNKGGVALFLEASLAEHAVVIGKSKHDLEWIAVKVNFYSPPLVIIAAYGCQTSKNSVEEMKLKWG